MLKSKDIPWVENEEVAALVKLNPASLNQEDLLKVVNALDVRLMRMWDKVGFEREKGLVDYGLLNPKI